MRPLICFCILFFLLVCVFGMSSEPAPKPQQIPEPKIEPADEITIFLTGNQLSRLKPCGCASGQLGGFDKRAAILKSTPAQQRLILDTGWFLTTYDEQDLIKFSTTFQALQMLDYDIINLNPAELDIANQTGLLQAVQQDLEIITSSKTDDLNLNNKITKKFNLKQKQISVTIASFDFENSDLEEIDGLFDSLDTDYQLRILILNNCDTETVDSIAKKDLADCLICPPEGEKPELLKTINDNLIVHVGRFGEYVAKLEVKPDDKKSLSLNYEAVGVSENLPSQQSLIDLYEEYKLIVADSNLIDRYPKLPLPDGLKYTGSGSCRMCHIYEYDKWSEKAHAHAYKTLVDINSQYDPQCAVCHVVGMKYETGFETEVKTPKLIDVGCENCHGPGSKHIESMGEIKTSEPKSKCVECHTQENSPDYDNNEDKYLQRIIHWRLPEDSNSPKIPAESK